MGKREKYSLKLRHWSAWSPHFPLRQDWLNWQLTGTTFPATQTKESPKNSTVLPMLRRRSSRLSKMALEVANDILSVSQTPSNYGIFCSRHGELNRTLVLLNSLVDKEPLSPMLFAQSVHNTASGLFSITNKQIIPTTSIAAQQCSVEQGWIEAYAYLQLNPEEQVLLVVFDETIPKEYNNFITSYEDIAFALLLVAESSQKQGTMISLNQKPISKSLNKNAGEWLFMHHLIKHIQSNKQEQWQQLGINTLWQWQIS